MKLRPEEKTTSPLTAVLYIRVSSKEQAEEGYSLDAQTKLLRDYACQKGIQIVHEFKDEETAKESGRKAFNEMLYFLKENPSIKYLLVEKTDRLSRNFRDIATMEDLMSKQDIHIVLVKENVEIHKDARSNEKFMFGIRAVMAKHFIDNLSEETKKGLNQKAESGHYPGLAPWGYKNVSDPKDSNRRIVVVDTVLAPLVREVFNLYAMGKYSYQDLAVLVHKRGIRSRLGKPVHRSRIEKMLKDLFYCGYFLWSDKLYKGDHPAIIERDVFDKVQQAMKEKGAGATGAHGAFLAYRGILKCGSCGCAITGEHKKKKSGKEYILYHCTNYYGKCKSEKQYYPEAELEKIFESVIQEFQVDDEVYELIRRGLKESEEDHQVSLKGEKEDYLQKKKNYERRLQKLYLDRVDEVIDDKFYRSTYAEWQKELDAINRNLLLFDNADKRYYDRGILFLNYAQKVKTYWTALRSSIYHEKALKAELLKVLLKDATLADGKLEFQLRKPFDELAKLLGSKQNKWGERRELNPQPPDPQSGALTRLSYAHREGLKIKTRKIGL